MTPTPLASLLAARIRAAGPLTLADYMAECLLHPQYGYYATRDPFGAKGDFVTAPEVSQMFGELLGLCLAQTWIDQGSPPHVVLAELGPGRGTLMADMLRAVRKVPGFLGSATVVLVEMSTTLRRIQADTVARVTDVRPRWVESVTDLPDAPCFLVANEFFDALPIRQFRRTRQGWAETVVGLAGDRLVLGQAAADDLPEPDGRFAGAHEGDIVEICPTLSPTVAEIGARVAGRGGAAIVIDYGGWRSRGDTFQAVRQHKPEDPLANPGEADLTAHVDFEAIAAGFRNSGASVTSMTPQGLLLERLGISRRAAVLARGLSGAAREQHLAAHRRLTHPSEMGDLFKAIACYPQGAAPPPGFDP